VSLHALRVRMLKLSQCPFLSMKHTGWIMILSAELPWSLQELDDNLSLIFINNHNEVCLICRSVITDSDSGEILCNKCGIVISDKIQENREESHIFFNTEQAKDRRRTGMPTSLASADMGLSTLSQEVMLVDMKLNHR